MAPLLIGGPQLTEGAVPRKAAVLGGECLVLRAQSQYINRNDRTRILSRQSQGTTR